VAGDGKSGKSVWVDSSKNASEGYNVNLCSKNLIYFKSNSGDAAKALSWMVAARHRRPMATSELTVGKGVVQDNNTIKELSSGGNTFCGRENHKDEIQFKMEGTLWAFANDLPEL
jgi:phage/plasmid-associated DNA primase